MPKKEQEQELEVVSTEHTDVTGIETSELVERFKSLKPEFDAIRMEIKRRKAVFAGLSKRKRKAE